MNIFVLNCGSSSVKYKLYDMKNEKVLADGRVERIGQDNAVITHQPAGRIKSPRPCPSWSTPRPSGKA